jgi:hypothetical protein
LTIVLSVLLSFDHCVVCPSVFWPLCCLSFCLLTIVLSVLLLCMASDYPFIIFKLFLEYYKFYITCTFLFVYPPKEKKIDNTYFPWNIFVHNWKSLNSCFRVRCLSAQYMYKTVVWNNSWLKMWVWKIINWLYNQFFSWRFFLLICWFPFNNFCIVNATKVFCLELNGSIFIQDEKKSHHVNISTFTVTDKK